MSHPFAPSPWAGVAAVARSLEEAAGNAPGPLGAVLRSFARRLHAARLLALRLAG